MKNYSKTILAILIAVFMLSAFQNSFASDSEIKNDRFTKDKDGNVTGFRYDFYNTAHNGKRITAITFAVAIYKWEDGKKIYLGLELYAVDCQIYQGRYDSFNFKFENWYGKADDLSFRWRYSFMSTN